MIFFPKGLKNDFEAAVVNEPSVFESLMDDNDLRFYLLFNSVSVISGRWADDNERLCAIEPRSRLKRSSPQAWLELTTARSVGQRLTH